MTEQKITKTVSDLGAAAYIMMHGHRILGRKGKNVYFEISTKEEKDFSQLELDYFSDDYHKFDSCLMALKRLGETSENLNTYNISDLGIAAYVMMHDFKIIGRKGKSIYFRFDKEKNTINRCQDLIKDYLVSPYHHFDSCLMALKKLGEYLPFKEEINDHA